MLSALAKYIFGGIIDDGPETTSMQYETREINDWLLVDMPDQDIDNEDMDSESEDDDILTAVPLLLAEEDSISPRQIVLSYEANSSCDKSCAKIRKGGSSKVQVHTGDKIQGNFVANVEAISLKTDEICNGKEQHNLSDIQDNIKPKQCKSKNFKPKKSKKGKINKKLNAKIQEKPVTIKKKYGDNVQEKPDDPAKEKSNDASLLDFTKENQCVPNEIPKKISTETEGKLVGKIEDSHIVNASSSNHRKQDKVDDKVNIAIILNSSHVKQDKVDDSAHIAIIDNSSHAKQDKVDDSAYIAIIDNSSHSKQDKVDDSAHIAIIDNSSHVNENKVEDNAHIAVMDNSSHKNQSICDNVLENKFQENIISDVPKYSDQKIPTNFVTIENNLGTVNKRSYADVVKAKFNVHDKVSVDQLCKDEPESPEVLLDDKTPDIVSEQNDHKRKPISKKNKSKKSRYNKMQNAVDIKSEEIDGSVFVNYQDELQENVSDNRDYLSDNVFNPSQFQENLKNQPEDYFNDKDASDTDKSNTKILHKYLAVYENFAENTLENYADIVQEDFDEKSKSEICKKQQNYETIQDSFYGKEAVLIDESLENFEMSDVQRTEDIFDRDLKYNSTDLLNEDIENFIDDIYYGPFPPFRNENKVNFTDNCQKVSTEVNDNVSQNSFEFQQSVDDTVLENIADLWDIYAKIDDEINIISDDEMSENFNREVQTASVREVNENSDEQVTDDEMNENSLDEYEEISDDELCGRYYGGFQHLFGEENGRVCNKMFEYSQDEESEESDDEMFTDITDCLTLSPIKRIGERKAKLLQSFKCDFLDELKQNASEIPKHHSSCIPFAEYELVEYFNFEPQYFYACQSLQYPSSYALAIAEYYSNHDQYLPKYSERCNALIQKYKTRAVVENQTPPALCESSLICNSADILQKIINQKCSALPTKTAVVLEHVKDLKPMQQAIQYEARKYLTRSQLNRQNRNYIYQSSTKTNRRRNLQRNPSGVNNNRKCY